MRGLYTKLAALGRDAKGAVSMLAAAGLVTVMAAGALAVDLGSVYYETRRLQGVADAAALSAAGNISTATTSAQAAITANNWSRTITPVVATGVWTPDPTRAVPNRFVGGSGSPNAARVTLTMDTPLYFGRVFGFQSIHVVRQATAARIDLASFSIGSRLAALNGGIANSLLSGLTGSSVSLSVADYNALLGADVDLLGFISALRTELALGAVSFDQVLSTTTTLPKVLSALQATLNAAGNTAAAVAVGKIAVSAPSGSVLPSALISLGQIGSQDHAASGTAINVNAYNTLTTLLQLSGGSRQVNLDLGASIPGLSSVSATVVFGDRVQNSPWIALTDKGTPIISTAQTRIYLQATALSSPALQLLGIGALRLPLYVELAAAQARLSSLTCSATGRSATLDVQPSIGHVSIAEINPASLSMMNSTPAENPAKIVTLPLITVTGSARVDLSSGGWQTVNFTTAEVDAQTTKTVSANGIVGAVATSLVSGLNLTINLLGLPISLSSITNLLKPLLSLMGPLLDGVLSSLFDLLGLHFGQADVRINGVRCGNAALVA